MPAVPDPPPPGRLRHAGVLTLTLAVFAGVVAVVTLQLRDGLRDQILRRDAETLAAIAALQLENSADDIDIFIAFLKISKLPGVAALQVFDAQKRFSSAWPMRWSDDPPSEDDWQHVSGGVSLARLHPTLTSQEFLGPLGTSRPGLVEAWVPLRRTGSPALLGAAQFWTDDEKTARDLAEHDRRLWTQAVTAWLVGSLVIGLAFRWALLRLDAANAALRARGEDLQRANRELVLAAKTTALGTVTAHLMHELKNPIAGLEMLMAGQGETVPRTEFAGGELAAASELTRRLRTMVNDVVSVLRDEQSGARFHLSCGEIVEIAAGKAQTEARQRGVTVEAAGPDAGSVSGRRGNLASLVLRNLLQNAVEATPAGGTVRLRGVATPDGGMEFRVEDEGPGLPPAVRERLFQPCASTKIGGSGLGLALSSQLAQQAGGRIELTRSNDQGSCFRLVLGPEA